MRAIHLYNDFQFFSAFHDPARLQIDEGKKDFAPLIFYRYFRPELSVILCIFWNFYVLRDLCSCGILYQYSLCSY